MLNKLYDALGNCSLLEAFFSKSALVMSVAGDHVKFGQRWRFWSGNKYP